MLLGIISVGSICGFLFFEHVLGLQPCPLCRMQQSVYIGLLVIAILTFVIPKNRLFLFKLAVFVFLVGGGIAFYQVGIEQHWWPAPAFCQDTVTAVTLEDLKAQILNKPPTDCGRIQWSFLGISMAGYNALISWICAGIFFFRR
jgi:disulfide bond formation protein DsbB